jgi:pimeloyl-ACP methyl ester carboxylesterase
MARARLPDVELEYETSGPESGPTVLLIMGIGQQLVAWPQAFLDALSAEGLFTVRYDARDTGRSTHFDHFIPPPVQEIMRQAAQGDLHPPYKIEDMAGDAAHLLDALARSPAHVVGVSMGGIVAQLMAVHFPEHVASLTSVMSTTGERDLPPARPEALAALLNRPKRADRAHVVAHAVQARRTLAGPGFKTPDAFWADLAARAFERDYSPAGFARHLMAVSATPPRTDILATIGAPTLVLHGADDPLIHPECGRRTAARIPGAQLELVPGMGHDLSPGAAPVLARRIAQHIRASGR